MCFSSLPLEGHRLKLVIREEKFLVSTVGFSTVSSVSHVDQETLLYDKKLMSAQVHGRNFISFRLD